jgi:nucleoside-diphosphate-sugar epimerase
MSGVVVVTGSSGLVGSTVAAALEARGHDVVGVDVRPGPYTSVVGDFRTVDVAGADAVVHIAALHAPHVGVRPDAEFWDVNVDATAGLLAAAGAAGVRRLVFTSTTSVYGTALVPDGEAVWVDESLPPQPRDVYDETKFAAEQLVAAASWPTVTLRIGRCFPEADHVVAGHRLHRGVDVRDVAQAFVRAVEQPLDATVTLNVAGPLVFTRADGAELLVDAAAVAERRLPGLGRAFAERSWPLPATIDRVYDSTLARSTLGYDPRYDVWSVLSRCRSRT